jgi:hypothetical protein
MRRIYCMQMKSIKIILFVLLILSLCKGIRAEVAYASEVYYYENGLCYRLLYDESNRETGNVEVGYPDWEYTRGYGVEANTIIPESVTIGGKAYRVTRIANYGFKGTNLESIALPSSVTEIGVGAFSECSSLTSITAVNEDIQASADAFINTAWFDSQQVEFIIFNNSLLKYQGTSTNVTIPEGVKTIGTLAFMDNDKIKTVTMPDTLKRIEDSAFLYCEKLNKVIFSKNLEYIGELAFSGTDLTSVSFPESLRLIGKGAFSGCELTELKLNSGLEVIGIEAFCGVPIKKVTIPKTVETISSLAFNFCENLTSVTISNGVKRIESNAFGDCKNLTKVTIPSSVNYIDEDAFYGTKWEKKLTDEFSIINHILVKYNGKSKTVKIPKGVTKILCSFGENPNLEKVVFPSSLNEIGSGAFSGCSLKEITIPGHIKTVGSFAFASCGLKKLTIERGVTNIGYNAFYSNQLTSISIPKSVLRIGDNAFEGNEKLTSVKFTEGGLEYIGQEAFKSCNLKSFNPPSTVRFMGLDIIEFNDNLQSISFPKNMNGISRICRDTEFKKLTKLTIPNGMKAIEFLRVYPKLNTIVLPDTLISINSLTFAGSNMEVINIPDGTNYIGFDAFEYCEKLKEVSIPDSVKYINREAFQGTEQVVFRCNENSTAYLYAQENGFKVVGPYVRK